MRLSSEPMRGLARVLAAAGVTLMLCGLWTCTNVQAAPPTTGSSGQRRHITVMT